MAPLIKRNHGKYGLNLFDTTDSYTEGISEEIVGKALKNKA
jgi:aryl-alcohol dehydrogenase-like predicted oxidoreductase